jgi:hypothetical protein
VVEGLQVEFITATRSDTSVAQKAFKEEAVLQRAWRHEQRRIFSISRFVESASKEGGNKKPDEEAPHRGISTWCQRRASLSIWCFLDEQGHEVIFTAFGTQQASYRHCRGSLNLG